MPKTTRLYYEDSFLETFDASVVDRMATQHSQELALDRTAFYPEGGGQPADTGSLNGFRVTDVQVRDGVVWHEVGVDFVGDTVVGAIDWPRRFDHIQQHHGQHLLSAAFENLFAISTVSFHLGAKHVTIDLETTDLSDDRILAAEQLANEVVWENRTVQSRFVTRDQLLTIPIRKPPTVADNIRIVSVEDFDHSPCGGTHPSQTGVVGQITVLKTERRGQAVRLEFACGKRALDLTRQMHREVRDLARELTVGMDAVRETVVRLRDNEVQTRKDLNEARSSLLKFEAAELLAAARQTTGVPIVSGNLGQRTGDELQGLAKTLAEHGACAILGATGEPAPIVVSSPDGQGLDCGALLKHVMKATGGRGGGRAGLARGAVPEDRLDEALRLLSDQAARGGEPLQTS